MTNIPGQKKSKHYRKYGKVTITDEAGNEKTLREEAWVRVHPATNHVILDKEGNAESRKVQKDDN